MTDSHSVDGARSFMISRGANASAPLWGSSFISKTSWRFIIIRRYSRYVSASDPHAAYLRSKGPCPARIPDREIENRSFARSGLHPDAPAVLLDDSLADRQPHASPWVFTLCTTAEISERYARRVGDQCRCRYRAQRTANTHPHAGRKRECARVLRCETSARCPSSSGTPALS